MGEKQTKSFAQPLHELFGRFCYPLIEESVYEDTRQLNTRPRKCLGFWTPNEVFKIESVALEC